MLENYFVAVVYLLSLLSLIALTLLSVGRFTPPAVAFGACVSIAVSAILLRKRSFVGRVRWGELGVLGILLLAVLIRSNPATFLSGGQDPGVYSSMGIHFARTGTLELRDSLLPELSDDAEVRAYYLKRSMHRLVDKGRGRWAGNMLPGVYLTNLERNEWDFQFYALHPMWLAVGNWVFGLHGQSWILVIFSALTVMSAYFMTRRITGREAPSLCAAFLLAINPGHAYFATFPVSETVAGFFFLSALYLLVDKRFCGFLAPLAALFLTRITGFLTAPLLLVSLGWMAIRRRDHRPLWAGFGVLAVYAMSFYWGLAFSPHYSLDIYKSKLHLTPGAIRHAWMAFVALSVLWAAFAYLVARQGVRLRWCARWLSRHRYALSGCVVTILLAVCAYRGYLLGFTDHYLQHRWYGARWKMAGHGWSSVSFLSLNTLRLLLSTTGLVGFCTGLVILGGIAFRRASVAPVVILGAGFSFAFLIGQLTTPITYYFARYLVSEVVPIACVCAAVALEVARRRLPSGGAVIFPLFGASVLFSVWPALVGRMGATEGEGLSRAVACIDEVTGPNSVLLVDRKGLALGAYAYTTPLRLGFGKRTYSILSHDFAGDPAKLNALISYFEGKGREVFLLSSSERWKAYPQFPSVLAVPIVQERLIGQRRLPTRYKKWRRTVRIFARQPIVRVPAGCGRVGG